MNKKILSAIIALVVVIPGIIYFMPKPQEDVTIDVVKSKYADLNNWVYFDEEGAYMTDVFFINPTAVGSEEYNMDMNDEKQREAFTGAVNMEKGLYDDEANFYAPFYSQVTLKTYDLPEPEREPYLSIAYEDVEEAFIYFMENINEGKPLVLAGFSQGGDMVKRLMINHPEYLDQLVAAYIIGWNVTDEDLDTYPQLQMATSNADTGVIVSFCSESEDITSSIIVPKTTNGINPLNWKTDSTLATKEENKGACFLDKTGSINKEIPQLCGAYLDPVRGTLKVLDVTPEEYPAKLSFLEDGNYHIYDYQFFYRNLEENVQLRIKNYQ